MPRAANPTVTATMRVASKTAAQKYRQLADEVSRTGAAHEKAGEKISRAGEKAARALKAQLSPTQQVTLAVKEQAAGSDYLQRRLVQLERSYMETEKQMRALARAGLPIPEGMARQAASARHLAETLEKRANVAMAKGKKSASDMRNKIFELGNNMSMAGGSAGQMGNQILSLVAPMIGGGGAAVAMVAVTGVAIGLAKAFNYLNREATEAEERAKGVAEGNKALAQRLDTLREKVLKQAQGEQAYRENQIEAQRTQIRLIDEKIAKAEQEAEQDLKSSNKFIVTAGNIKQARAGAAEQLRKERDMRLETISLLTQEGSLTEIDKQQQKAIADEKRANLADLRAAQKAAHLEKVEQKKEEREIRRNEILDSNAFFANARANMRAELQEDRAKISAMNAAYKAGIRERRAFEEEAAREREKDELEFARLIQQSFQTGQTFASAFYDLVSSEDEDSRNSSKKRIADLATAEIMSAAAAGAAEAFKSQAGIPVIGPILGAVAATVVFAAIMALRSKVVGFATGGIVDGRNGAMVTGGITGRDSVLVEAQRGEPILPVNLANALRRVLNANGPAPASASAFATAPAAASRPVAEPGAPRVVLNYTSSNLFPDAIRSREVAVEQRKHLQTMMDRGLV